MIRPVWIGAKRFLQRLLRIKHLVGQRIVAALLTPPISQPVPPVDRHTVVGQELGALAARGGVKEIGGAGVVAIVVVPASDGLLAPSFSRSMP